MLATALALSLAGCSKPAPKVEEVRPVRVIRTAAKPVDVIAEFPGEVRPRVESRLGFRVGGKIISRKVDVGATVKRGQVLMQLDPQDLQLAQAQANAGLKAAESNYQLAKAELARYQELREKNFVSQAVLDSKNTAYLAARASYDQAVAAYRSQSNMAGYATLVADADGVVAGIDAEVGQVVAAGTPVLRLAQAGEKEIVIGIPEDKVDALRRISDVKVRIWAMPDAVFKGKIREIAPMADPATRTYTARVAIPDAPAGVKLGMTAYVTFASASPQAMLRLPLTAIFQDKNGSAVWVVENGAVKPVPVQLAGPAGNDVLIAGGIAPGQSVVTAGVNLLKPGQKVKILDEENAGTSVATSSGNGAGAGK
ncbi:RND family efflux transporter MFP subunit [Paucimonas lemoignei]|uniref:RND family efflux transporter MFP subunit n=2 Tax=Paucimonas lemoignei TaxID=29443 RepID=A0A4R3I5F5_PAULE|nr:RND family efflux transporter MFP subunit [Paucimonas lemoignei]